MVINFTLLGIPLYIDRPQELIGWVGWLLMAGILALLLFRWRHLNKKWTGLQGGIFVGLLVLLILTNIFFKVQISNLGALQIPAQPGSTGDAAVAVLAALPWVLAAGLLGVFPAAGLGLLSGAIIALLDTHSMFTLLEYGLMATFLGSAFHQRYRTRFFQLLRHPLFATVLLALTYPLLYLLDVALASPGSLAARLDIAFSQVEAAALVVGVQLLVAGLVSQVIALFFPRLWGFSRPLEPSPVERRLQSRFLFSLALMAILVAVGLMAGDWVVASRAATGMLNDRLDSTSKMAANNVPAFLETGQNLIQLFAKDPTWTEGTLSEKNILLGDILRTIPYFSEVYLLDVNGQPVTGYPVDDFYDANPSAEEYMGITHALSGVPIQMYTLPPTLGGVAARLSFQSPVYSGKGTREGVLVGRTDLGTNPFFESISISLNSLANINGEGMLLDDNNTIIYSSTSEWVMQTYQGQSSLEGLAFEGVTPDDIRSLMFYQPVWGRLWGVVTSTPMQEAQQIALQIAAPLMVIIVILFLIAALVMAFSLRSVTASLQNLAQETNRISSGELDSPLELGGNDEVGQLGHAFENMRTSLKARLDELNRLLQVSRGVASSLEFQESVKPVLEAALSTGASAVRVVLTPEALPEMKGGTPAPNRFGSGADHEQYSYLDDQILPMVRQKEVVALNNLSRVRLLTFPPNAPRPEALLALPLHHENMFYGAIWLAYNTPHQFNEDEIRFLTTIAGQAALASANSQLFSNAEIGRQRLAATLNSTPDPVLVTDYQGRLLLANPAAWQVLGLPGESVNGKSIDSIIQQPALLGLLQVVSEEKQSAEVELGDGKVYLATASSVIVEGQPVGRVCILRDVTRFKELDTLKSEFVATVSHDLRYPLTTMRGYATMLEMVGELNEQQTGYVKKILTSVDGMNQLVTSLLDLGRIDAGVDLQLEMVPVQEVVDRVVGALQLQASQKQVVISSDISQHAIPLIEADYALLQQALHNLIENAVVYTEPRGKISVRVEPDKDQMVFTVVDTGIGIAPVDLPRIFEKFYRADSYNAAVPGTGLGMTIVKYLVDAHHGQIAIDSAHG
ncbi:MAG: HAMP domain-containing protein, partial [Anaerolineae bacterium]|nr:HAMP domain-containing protein [Anaerolineae bacterium]